MLYGGKVQGVSFEGLAHISAMTPLRVLARTHQIYRPLVNNIESHCTGFRSEHANEARKTPFLAPTAP